MVLTKVSDMEGAQVHFGFQSKKNKHINYLVSYKGEGKWCKDEETLLETLYMIGLYHKGLIEKPWVIGKNGWRK